MGAAAAAPAADTPPMTEQLLVSANGKGRWPSLAENLMVLLQKEVGVTHNQFKIYDIQVVAKNGLQLQFSC
jgi:hypothetical protein